MKEKLVFVVESPFSQRDWSRFAIDYLSTQFEVAILDITGLVDRDFWYRNKVLQISNPLIHSFERVDDLLAHLEQVAPVAMIMNLGLHSYRRQLINYSRKNKIVTAEFQLGAIPGDTSVISFGSKIRLFCSRPKKTMQALKLRVERIRYSNMSPTLFFRGGQAAIARSPLKETRVIDVHSLDYELVRELKDRLPWESSISSQQYVVYIDQDLGFHPDFARNEVKPPVTPEVFYPALCDFFSNLAKHTGLEVIVAPHPRSDRTRTMKLFPNTTVSDTPTAELIRNSRAVLTHYSTAVSFAIMFEKPVVQIVTSELLNSTQMKFVAAYSQALGSDPLNIDDFTQFQDFEERFINYDQERYEQYFHLYISAGQDQFRHSWEIVAAEIRKEIESLS